ncbi:Probable beta-glucosidase A [Taphrina deformans PYCC 5710]|uniref:Probable beta-glucosidase G n=1 Tax=Taphrina deformans (strain PYCC 5710 / ATCC 11124 / CBS 356.35 / IMI 108563 / JCM 9778 / NBRC 8474) TaxID=1097556 RepID=R4XBF7_TAPDE|nr:Probable beta-glucosidase A [Taphrina deformans PYCC 5710]|eukprot:CCG83194.1 Probable beta-glucosidase A [Taphrina deformans PYCC 5710]
MGSLFLLGFLSLASAQGTGYSSFNSSYDTQHISGPNSPPYYPTPGGTGYSAQGDWVAAYAAATAFVKKLTLVEKVNITTGTGWEKGPCVGQTGSVPSQGFNGLCLQDSPLGVRDTNYNTVFPPLSQAAKTWDRDLIRRHGLAMGEEFKAKGANVQLGPVCGPLGTFAEGGRNWEGFSPDPYLCGQAMYESIVGIQAAGTLACAKHFIGNEQEHFRQSGEAAQFEPALPVLESISSNIDDRVMHELYLWPFSDAVRAGVNNSYACQNSALINGILKDELDFQGYDSIPRVRKCLVLMSYSFVVSDWGAVHSGVATYLAGTDMLMPGDGNAFSDGLSWFGRNLTISVLNGTVPESLLDDKAIRIMAAYFKLQQNVSFPSPNFNSFSASEYGYLYNDKTDFTQLNQYVDVRAQHALVAQEVNEQSIILLKNDNSALPLTNSTRWLNIIGSDATSAQYGANGCADRGCDNGTLGIGWGSGSANFPYLVTPAEAISARARAQGQLVYTITDDYAYAEINSTVGLPYTASLVFINSDSGEGYISVDGNQGDRNNLTAWHGGDRLVETVAANCNNTIVIVHSVGPITMESWIGNPNVTAVVWAGLPGQESGNTLASMLYGDYSPSGKLTFTIARNASDYGQQLMYLPNAPIPQYNFTTTNIDYRHFDSAGITPRYEFGYGLSYSRFTVTPGNVTLISSKPYAARSSYPTAPAASLQIPRSALNASAALAPRGATLVEGFNYPYLQNTTQAAPGPGYPYPYPYTGNGTSSSSPPSPAGGGPGGNPSLFDVLYRVSASVRNVGRVAGSEVVQLYVSFPENSTAFPTAPNQLRGFSKVFLMPNASATVTFDVLRKDLSVWNTLIQNWQFSAGQYVFRVGNSSRQLQTVGRITLQ